MVGGGAIAEQGDGELSVLGPVDTRLVHAVEHEIDVRDQAGIPPKELQEPPNGEHGPALHTSEVEIHEKPPPMDDDTESGEIPCLHQVGEGYTGAGPGKEVT